MRPAVGPWTTAFHTDYWGLGGTHGYRLPANGSARCRGYDADFQWCQTSRHHIPRVLCASRSPPSCKRACSPVQIVELGRIAPENLFHIGIGQAQIPASLFHGAERFEANQCRAAIRIRRREIRVGFR